MQRTSIPCPDCNGEGGFMIDDEKPIKTTYDHKHGETYHSNWVECEKCRGTGEVEAEDLEP